MANISNEELKKLLEDYQQNKPIPEVSEEEFQDTKSKPEAIQQPFTQQLPQVEPSNLPLKGPIVQEVIQHSKEQNPVLEQIKEQPKLPLTQDNELDGALNLRNKMNLFNNLTKAGMIAGHAISGVPLTKETMDAFTSDSSQPVEDIKIRDLLKSQRLTLMAKQDEQDPNSTKSKLARETYKQITGKDAPLDASFESINDLMKSNTEYQKMLAHKEEAVAKRFEAVSKFQALKEEKEASKIEKYVSEAQSRMRPLIKDYSDSRQALEKVKGIDPKNPVQQVTTLYNFIKELDKGSAVREGEINLGREAQGLSGKMDVVLSQLTTNPNLISPKVAQKIINEVERISKIGEGAYKTQRDSFLATAKHRGIPEERFSEIDPFYSEFKDKNLKENKKQQLIEQFKKIKSGSSVQETQSDMIRIKDPNGIIRLVPKDKESAAIAAGGVRID